MADAVWLDPSTIRWKISPAGGLKPSQGGDWDIERRVTFAETAKYQAVVDRFVHGRAWEETELFARYRFRLACGPVRGQQTIEALAGYYYARYDALFEAMKRDGFRLDSDGVSHPLPGLLVGRDGDVFIGDQGNHRLAMAQIMGLDRIAGRIVCRHSLYGGSP